MKWGYPLKLMNWKREEWCSFSKTLKHSVGIINSKIVWVIMLEQRKQEIFVITVAFCGIVE